MIDIIERPRYDSGLLKSAGNCERYERRTQTSLNG
jgi:hypothetical protein